ncbi:transcription-repair coupling factor [Candidatus Peregrinibacteria bacterium CG_4_9_14_0_2_um_filter_53_11]|nr:MAG: transcription-repair coupling factor [Candidatus Peregrinibacteria bacterium CG_4_9_14_0_2_um_filter_53_11]
MSFEEGLITFFPKLQNTLISENYQRFPAITISGAGNFASKAFILADLMREQKQKPILWIVNDQAEQENVARSCEEWFGPSWEVKRVRFDHADERQKKIDILYTLKHFMKGERTILVVPYTTLIAEMPDHAQLQARKLLIEKGQSVTAVELFERLIAEGYEVSDDEYLERGSYLGNGGVLSIFPVNSEYPVRIEFEFDVVSDIFEYRQETGEIHKKLAKLNVSSLGVELKGLTFFDFVNQNGLIVDDELEVTDEFFETWEEMFQRRDKDSKLIAFTPFPEDTKSHISLRYLSVLKYQDLLDMAHELKEKNLTDWRVIYFTKHMEAVADIFKDRKVRFTLESGPFTEEHPAVRLMPLSKDEVPPSSFQAGDLNVLVISDRDVANLREEKQRKVSERVFWEFLTSLKPNDLVVHINHGVARFEGLEKRMIDNVTREYLRLGYAENDKLFVPIDQADKVNKFVGSEDDAPKLTRLGSTEWATMTKRVKKETEEIAQELLLLYAERKRAKGRSYELDMPREKKFEESFPYEETPGQRKAIEDVKKDMAKPEPMDRLICGDVGFGKTEVAMRAAFNAVQNGKQVALVSPITILADQHYRSFQKRMEDFDVRVDVLSRFRSPREQKLVLEKLKRGEVDIVVGTHRLLQKDVAFKDLGLVIVDEEQRFGVKQKEKFKQLRAEVDILTLTATPIPRTLNICLNKLRDISTITTPPPGRLPVITEVRRYSHDLIREAILRELKRGGQVYFLHNRVQTIDAIAERLRALVPEARFCVAHGKLLSKELEERIVDFKEHRFDVLVSSTIIENGIDLANANTLIVNNAEKFGLAQLYQLRGRVGRSKSQAYAYFLYHSQRLRLDAKKRLRAIVEASELGAGFQIAMKDLEIRGAGDILGVNQHGVINMVGVSHFIRMLNRAVEDLQAGKSSADVSEEPEISVELPLTAYVPDHYIVNTKEKINVYQRMAAADSLQYLDELKEDVVEDYGKLPREVVNLFRVIKLKILAKRAGVLLIKAEGAPSSNAGKQIVLQLGKQVKPESIIYMLQRNDKWTITGTKLKIDIKDLGMQWLDELHECVKMLGEKVDKDELTNGNGKAHKKPEESPI